MSVGKKLESPPQPELFRFQPFRQAPILGVIRLDYDAGLGEFYSPAWVNHVLTGEMRAPGYISGVRSHWRAATWKIHQCRCKILIQDGKFP